jgi:broad specificity phosphatase PhoE
MSSLLLLRHGQASFGAEVYDRLSALGEQQAEATGAFMQARGLRFDRVLTGPLQRQTDTARGVLSRLSAGGATQTSLQTAAEVTPALAEFAEGQHVLRSAERHFGLRLHGEGAPERRVQLRQHDALIAAWAAGQAAIDGAGTMAEFRLTIAGWLRALTDASAPRQHLLAVTSAGVIGTLVCELLGLPDARMIEFTRMVHNASLTEIVFGAGRCSLMSFNSTAHLPPGLVSAT